MRAPGPDRDRGTIALYTVLFTPVVFLLAGLLVDGGLAIHARQRAADMAEQAARAGANQIDEDALRATGEPAIDTGRACPEALALLAEFDTATAGPAECVPTTAEVTVTVTIRVELQLLSIAPGFHHFTMTSTASAHPDTGDNPEG
jgi:Flp pilus assembly protein TadG